MIVAACSLPTASQSATSLLPIRREVGQFGRCNQVLMEMQCQCVHCFMPGRIPVCQQRHFTSRDRRPVSELPRISSSRPCGYWFAGPRIPQGVGASLAFHDPNAAGCFRISGKPYIGRWAAGSQMASKRSVSSVGIHWLNVLGLSGQSCRMTTKGNLALCVAVVVPVMSKSRFGSRRGLGGSLAGAWRGRGGALGAVSGF